MKLKLSVKTTYNIGHICIRNNLCLSLARTNNASDPTSPSAIATVALTVVAAGHGGGNAAANKDRSARSPLYDRGLRKLHSVTEGRKRSFQLPHDQHDHQNQICKVKIHPMEYNFLHTKRHLFFVCITLKKFI